MAVGARETVDTMAFAAFGDRSNYRSTVLTLFSVGGLGALHSSRRRCVAVAWGRGRFYLAVGARETVDTMAFAAFGDRSNYRSTVLTLFSVGGLGAT